MTIETTVNKHRGALLIAIGGFLVFLYIRHKRQQAAAQAAADAAAAAAAAAAAQDPGTMDQATYDKQFSQPAPAYLGSPFSGYGANAPNFPPPAQGAGPATPTPPITFPNPAASSGNSTVGAATGGGAPASGATGIGPVIVSSGPPAVPPIMAKGWAGLTPAELAAAQQQAANNNDVAAALAAYNYAYTHGGVTGWSREKALALQSHQVNPLTNAQYATVPANLQAGMTYATNQQAATQSAS